MAADLLKVRCSHHIAPTLSLLLDNDNLDHSKVRRNEASLGWSSGHQLEEGTFWHLGFVILDLLVPVNFCLKELSTCRVSRTRTEPSCSQEWGILLIIDQLRESLP